MKKVSFLRRYATFFVVGIIVEAIRLLSFWVIEKSFAPEVANLFSLLINIVTSFLFHGGITWKDRHGSWWTKLVRFSGSKWLTWTIKAGLFPFWIRAPFLSCPLYDLTHSIVDCLGTIVPILGHTMHALFTCEWMSLALMDLVIALTIGFITHDRFSFWEKKSK